jgi:serine protease Do
LKHERVARDHAGVTVLPAAPPGRRTLLAGLLALPALPACAQRVGPADFADLAARVLPAVVSIVVTGRNADIPPELRGTPLERQFRGRPTIGAGSGFVIDPAGLVVTNGHVIEGGGRVSVGLSDGAEVSARVIGVDELTDLALLRIEGRSGLASVAFGSSAAMRVGNWVLAAGNPFGLGGTITVGIVSALGRDINAGPFDAFIQTDAAINPGNSGGPLFNAAGEVVGINTAIFSPSGASVGIGFAVPSDLARAVIEEIRRNGSVVRGWLGVSVADLPAPGRRGVLIQGVERNSPASRAGLRPGDVVTTLNGERVDSTRALIRGVAAITPGQTARLSLLREGRSQDIAVQVGRRPAAGG